MSLFAIAWVIAATAAWVAVFANQFGMQRIQRLSKGRIHRNFMWLRVAWQSCATSAHYDSRAPVVGHVNDVRFVEVGSHAASLRRVAFERHPGNYGSPYWQRIGLL